MRHSSFHARHSSNRFIGAYFSFFAYSSPYVGFAGGLGCYNCRGSYLRGDAPWFERLSIRMARLKGDPTAEKRHSDSFRAGELFQHLDAHARLSDESATALIHWLADGAK